MHEDPQVPNFGEAGRGMKLRAGMVIAIEPMVNVGKPDDDTGGGSNVPRRRYINHEAYRQSEWRHDREGHQRHRDFYARKPSYYPDQDRHNDHSLIANWRKPYPFSEDHLSL
jgi:methionine aminopeptidase